MASAKNAPSPANLGAILNHGLRFENRADNGRFGGHGGSIQLLMPCEAGSLRPPIFSNTGCLARELAERADSRLNHGWDEWGETWLFVHESRAAHAGSSGELAR